MDIQNFLFWALSCSMLLAFCISVGRHKYLPLVLKPITWYLLVELIAQGVINSITWWYPNQNKYFLFHIGFVLEAVTLILMYREIFKKYVEVGGKGKYVYRKIFIVLIVLFVSFAVVNALCWQSINTYPSITRIVLSTMIIVLNVLYIYKYTIAEPVPRTGLELTNYQASRVSLFWITIGLLLFHSFSLFRYIFINRFRKELSEELLKENSLVYTALAIILFVFIAIGLLKGKGIKLIDDNTDNTVNSKEKESKN